MGCCFSLPVLTARPFRLHRLRLLSFFSVAASLAEKGLGLHIYNGHIHGIVTYEQSVVCVSNRTGRIVRAKLSDFVGHLDNIYIVEYTDMSSSMLRQAHRTADRLLAEQIGMTDRHWSTFRNGHLSALCWTNGNATFNAHALELVDHVLQETTPRSEGELDRESSLCPICFDIVDQGSMVSLPCSHVMHHACLYEQLLFGLHRCSLCRSSIVVPLKIFRRATEPVTQLYNLPMTPFDSTMA